MSAGKQKRGKIETVRRGELAGRVTDAVLPMGKVAPFWVGFRFRVLVIFVVGLALYSNTFMHGFAFDDRMAIVGNDNVQRGVAGIPAILTTDAYQSYMEKKGTGNQLAGGRYRPLSLVTFAVEQELLGKPAETGNTRQWEEKVQSDMHLRHVVNVLLYVLTVVLLLRFLEETVFPGREWIALATALLLLVHPLHTEVVANVKSRDEVLSLLFIMLTLRRFLRFAETGQAQDRLWGLFFYFLALLSKEYALTLVVLLPVTLYVFTQATWKKCIRVTLPIVIPLVLYLALRFAAGVDIVAGADKNPLNYPYLYATVAQKFATIFYTLGWYLKLLIAPYPLVADYSYAQVSYQSWANPLVWLSVAVYAGLFAGMIVAIRRRHVVGFALAFYLVNLLVVSNLFVNVGTPLAERFMYHSSVGFVVVVGFAGNELLQRVADGKRRQVALWLAMSVVVLCCGMVVIGRNRDWDNERSLFLADVRKAPNSVLMNNNAAAACMANARDAQDTTERNIWFRKAILYFDKAVSLYPADMLAYANRGLCYYDMGAPELALNDWDTVRAEEPGNEKVTRYLGIAGQLFFARGLSCERGSRTDSACYYYKKAVDAAPGSAETWFRLGVAEGSAGQPGEEIKCLQKAAALAPGDTVIRNVLQKRMNGQ